jgi:tight adherence protein C
MAIDILELAADPVNFVTFGVGILSFATIATLAAPLGKRDTLGTRLKAVANRREELKRRSREALKGKSLRHTDETWYKQVVEKLQLSRLIEDPKIVERLAEAGYRGPGPISTFYFFRFVMPFVTAALFAFYLFEVKSFDWSVNTRLAVSFLGLGVGFYAPNIYLKNQAQKRMISIAQVFPDTLDLLLICVEAGMSIEAALQKVAGEIGSQCVELCEEMTLLVAELSYLPERRLAYEGMSKRVPYPGVRSVMTAMIQAERYGTPLGNALRVMAKENRDLRMAAAEKKAAALPAKLTVPMILFFLPVLFIVILGPAAIHVTDILKSTPALQ